MSTVRPPALRGSCGRLAVQRDAEVHHSEIVRLLRDAEKGRRLEVVDLAAARPPARFACGGRERSEQVLLLALASRECRLDLLAVPPLLRHRALDGVSRNQ